MDECKVCANADNEYCFACDNGNHFKPKTNADRIRAMTDEELAEFLLNRDLNIVEKASKAVGFTYKVDREQCLVNVIGWLKEEVVSDG
jgi:hypothetical protein